MRSRGNVRSRENFQLAMLRPAVRWLEDAALETFVKSELYQGGRRVQIPGYRYHFVGLSDWCTFDDMTPFVSADGTLGNMFVIVNLRLRLGESPDAIVMKVLTARHEFELTREKIKAGATSELR